MEVSLHVILQRGSEPQLFGTNFVFWHKDPREQSHPVSSEGSPAAGAAAAVHRPRGRQWVDGYR